MLHNDILIGLSRALIQLIFVVALTSIQSYLVGLEFICEDPSNRFILVQLISDIGLPFENHRSTNWANWSLPL